MRNGGFECESKRGEGSGCGDGQRDSGPEMSHARGGAGGLVNSALNPGDKVIGDGMLRDSTKRSDDGGDRPEFGTTRQAFRQVPLNLSTGARRQASLRVFRQ